MGVIKTYKPRCYGLSKDGEVTYGYRSPVRFQRGYFDTPISIDRNVNGREDSDR